MYKRQDYDYTEENSNNIGWQKVEVAFDKPENRIMIVCDKFQTGFNPVSYTHLDVYKRQEKSNTSTFNGPGILIAGDGAGAGRIFHNVEGEYAVHQRVYRLARCV